MNYSSKFRELIIEPNLITFSNWKFHKILEYYHAGNDVLHCLGTDNKHYILKLARHKDSDFKNQDTISKKLLQLGWNNVQPCIEHGFYNNIEYLVLPHSDGFRISNEITTYRSNEREFCFKFGESISNIHEIKISTSQIKPRRFHIINNMTQDNSILMIYNWLNENKINLELNCFIHGDHHNANLLWNKNNISYILDWELAGIGNREFDLAWATLPRPGQRIFFTKKEEENILTAYSKKSNFDYKNYQYYKILIISHFISFSSQNRAYMKWVKMELTNTAQININY